MRVGVVLGRVSDTGDEPSASGDSYGYFEPETNDQFDRLGRLIIIADGTGVEKAGDLVSQTAIEQIRDVYFATPGHDVLHGLRSAVVEANSFIHGIVKNDPDLSDMTTTVTALVIRDGHAYIAHVGNSRAYLARDGLLMKLTDDHTLVNKLIADGTLSKAEAEAHPDAHILERALGSRAFVEVDLYGPFELFVGDRFLLCSRRFYREASDDDIREAVVTLAPKEACESLIAAVNERGEQDDKTIQILQLGTDLPALQAAAVERIVPKAQFENVSAGVETAAVVTSVDTSASPPSPPEAETPTPAPEEDAPKAIEKQLVNEVAVDEDPDEPCTSVAMSPGPVSSRPTWLGHAVTSLVTLCVSFLAFFCWHYFVFEKRVNQLNEEVPLKAPTLTESVSEEKDKGAPIPLTSPSSANEIVTTQADLLQDEEIVQADGTQGESPALEKVVEPELKKPNKPQVPQKIAKSQRPPLKAKSIPVNKVQPSATANTQAEETNSTDEESWPKENVELKDEPWPEENDEAGEEPWPEENAKLKDQPWPVSDPNAKKESGPKVSPSPSPSPGKTASPNATPIKSLP